jgi:hypothetical protein
MIDTAPTIDRDEIIRAFDWIIEPGAITELRALDACTKSDRFPQTYSGYFDNAQAVANAVATLQSAKGIYIVPNALPKALLSRANNRIRPAKKQPLTSDHDVTARRWLKIDLDPARPAGISSTDAEHSAALELAQTIFETLRELHGWPMPIFGDSGNGGHLMYPIDLPVDDGGLESRVLAALAKEFDTDAVKVDLTTFNPSRIWKLYGTPACKGDSTEDRPHRVSRIISAPHTLETLTREQLDAVGGPAPATTPAPARNGHCKPANGKAIDLGEWLNRFGIGYTGPEDWRSQRGLAKRYMLDACVWNPAHTDHSAWAAQFADGALAAGCSHNSCHGLGWDDLRAKFDPKKSNGEHHRHSSNARQHETNSADESENQPDADAAPKLSAVGAGELLANFPELRPPLIEGVLRLTESANMIDAAKGGKTHTAIDLALCVPTGRAWLGRYAIINPGAVLYIDAELHPNTMARRIASICSARGIFSDEIAGKFDVLSLRGRLKNIFELRFWLAKHAAGGKYRLIVFDALYRLIPEGIDENSNSDMTRVFNAIDQIGEETGAATLIIHHASKGVQAGKSVVDVGSGASAMARATDSHIIFRQHEQEGCKVMEMAGRSWQPLSPVVLRWTYPTWNIDETLDPTDLRENNRRKRKEEKADDSTPAETPEPWTAERFVATFVTDKPLDKQTILAKATTSGISQRKADAFLRLAMDAKAVHRWAFPKVTTVYLASIEQPVTQTAEVPK